MDYVLTDEDEMIFWYNIMMVIGSYIYDKIEISDIIIPANKTKTPPASKKKKVIVDDETSKLFYGYWILCCIDKEICVSKDTI